MCICLIPAVYEYQKCAAKFLMITQRSTLLTGVVVPSFPKSTCYNRHRRHLPSTSLFASCESWTEPAKTQMRLQSTKYSIVPPTSVLKVGCSQQHQISRHETKLALLLRSLKHFFIYNLQFYNDEMGGAFSTNGWEGEYILVIGGKGRGKEITSITVLLYTNPILTKLMHSEQNYCYVKSNVLKLAWNYATCSSFEMKCTVVSFMGRHLLCVASQKDYDIPFADLGE
jgi:hypothetical protein